MVVAGLDIKLYRIFPKGTEVWAFKVERLEGKSCRYSIRKPMLGVITNDGFVPYKIEDKILIKELDYSKKIAVSGLIYSDSKEEAIRVYNNMIKNEISEYEKRIERLNKELVRDIV